MTNSFPTPSKLSSHTKGVHDRLIRMNCCNYVMIKDLSLHRCILWFSVFECKKILRLDAFFPSLLETCCL
jgi:hypothetical protein